MIGAAPAPQTAGEASSEVFASGFPVLVDLLKLTAPLLIGAALTVLALRWIVRSVARGQAPSLDDLGGSGGRLSKRLSKRPGWYDPDADAWFKDQAESDRWYGIDRRNGRHQRYVGGASRAPKGFWSD